ncbi:cortactin-binding protein 2-like isoform X2 [Ptychodera flava]|uniref:cortactin-binding protein 2-like isoform X2 n=1 Tax=Ptychodera flava TaxID=63121 RepID=UPI00396A2DC6
MADLKARNANVDSKKPVTQKGLKPKVTQNLTKQDLLKLLSLLEGELQARDFVILNMKQSEKERLAHSKLKYGKFIVGDPFSALQRDTDSATVDGGTKNAAVPYNPITHLETLIAQHKKEQDKMQQQLKELEASHAKVVKELEEEKQKHAQDTAQGDDVTYMLEKERERLIQQVEFEKAQQKKLEKDTKRTQTLLKEERAKHQQFAVLLVKERKRLASKLIEERQKTRELTRQLEEERSKIQSMAEGLKQESKKSLKMEAEMEKQLSDFDTEKEQMKAKVHREENRTKELRKEIANLKRQIFELEGQLKESGLKVRGHDDKKSNVSSASMISSIKDAVSKHSTSKHDAKQHSSDDGQPRGLSPSELGFTNVAPAPSRTPHSSYTPKRSGSPYNIRTVEDDSGKVEVKFTPKALAGKTGIPVKQESNLPNATSGGTAGSSSSRLNSTSPSFTNSGKKSPINSRGTPPPVPPNKPILKKDANKNPPPSAARGDSLVETRKQFYATKFSSDGTMDNRSMVNANANVSDTEMSNQSPASSPDSTSSGSSTSSVVLNPNRTTTNQVRDSPWRRGQHDVPTSAAATASDNENRNNPNTADIEQLLVTMTTGTSQDPKAKDISGSNAAMPPVYAAAASGNTDVLKKLLVEENQDPNVSISDGITPLHAAAESGYHDCVEVLLKQKADANATRQGNFTPLHAAAGEGHHGSVKCLLEYGADASKADKSGWQPLHWAVFNGHSKCAKYLIDYGASRAATTKDGWTPLHSAVQAGHAHCLGILLNHKPKTHHKDKKPPEINEMVDKLSPDLDKILSESEESLEIQDDQSKECLVSADLLNTADKDGWTVAHFAASKGFKECLEMLCNQNNLNIKKTDKQDRKAYDVATESCKELLDNLGARKIKVVIDMKGDTTPKSPSTPQRSATPSIIKEGDEFIIGQVIIKPDLSWPGFDEIIAATLVAHSKELGAVGREMEDTDPDNSDENSNIAEKGLGLTGDSILCYVSGSITWYPEEDNDDIPYEFFSSRHRVYIQLMGLREGCLDKLAYESLIPIHTLQTYYRLIEQYKSVVFYGPPGTGKTYIARKLGECIKHKQKTSNGECEVTHVTLNPKYGKKDLFKLLQSKGFLLSTKEEGKDAVPTPILVLDDLSRISLADVFGELLYALENRGPQHPINVKLDESDDGKDSVTGSYYLQENCYVLGTMDKPRSTGLDLVVQQKFRWVHLKCDGEPVKGLLQRHLRRRLIHKYSGKIPCISDSLCKAVEWICGVWQRLNACLTKLGLSELVLGPRHFFACPIEVNKPKAILRWLSLSWNHAIAPGVEDAVLRGCTSVMQGHHKVATTALFVLLQRAVVPGCPLSQTEAERYLSSFRGGSIGSVHLSVPKKSSKNVKKTSSFGWKHSPTTGKKKDKEKDNKKPKEKAATTVTVTAEPCSSDSDDTADSISESTKKASEEIARQVLEALDQPPIVNGDAKTTSLPTIPKQQGEQVMEALKDIETGKSESELNKIIRLHDQLFGQSIPSKSDSPSSETVIRQMSSSKNCDAIARDRSEVGKSDKTSSAVNRKEPGKKEK